MRIFAVAANIGAVFLGLYLYLYDGLFYGPSAPLVALAFFALPLMNIFTLFKE